MYLVLCEDEPEFAEELGRELKGFFEKKKWSVKSADGSGYEEDTEPMKTKKAVLYDGGRCICSNAPFKRSAVLFLQVFRRISAIGKCLGGVPVCESLRL